MRNRPSVIKNGGGLLCFVKVRALDYLNSRGLALLDTFLHGVDDAVMKCKPRDLTLRHIGFLFSGRKGTWLYPLSAILRFPRKV